MQINVENPRFLFETLQSNILDRVRHLVEQGIAYDSNWRDDFVELFKIVDQLCICEEKVELPDANAYQDPSSGGRFPIGTPVIIGKGKTIWTVEDSNSRNVRVSRDGKGKNEMVVDVSKVKIPTNFS